MGRRKARERDVLPFPFPSPPAPAAHVTRRRLRTSQGGQVYFADAADGSLSFETTLSGERHTKKLSALSKGFDYVLYKVVIKPEQSRPVPNSPINFPLS